jgi:hypothetical protein
MKRPVVNVPPVKTEPTHDAPASRPESSSPDIEERIDAVLNAALEPSTPEKQFGKIKLPSPPSRRVKVDMPLTLKEVMETTAERDATPSHSREKAAEGITAKEVAEVVAPPKHVLPSIKADQEMALPPQPIFDKSTDHKMRRGEKQTDSSPAFKKTYLSSPAAPVSSPSLQLLSEHHNSSSPSKNLLSAKNNKELKKLQNKQRKKDKRARKEKNHQARKG